MKISQALSKKGSTPKISVNFQSEFHSEDLSRTYFGNLRFSVLRNVGRTVGGFGVGEAEK